MILQQTNRLTLEGNADTHTFQVRLEGMVVFDSARYVNAENEYIRLGGVVVAPKAMSKRESNRMERESRQASNGYGHTKSAARR